jgi:hypothetical protein
MERRFSDRPRFPPTFVVDCIAGNLGNAGVIAAFRRCAREGGSYHVRVNLSRRAIWRSNLLSGRLAGLLLADQGAEVFVERAGATPAADQRVALDDAYLDRGKIALPPGAAADGASADIVIVDGAAIRTGAAPDFATHHDGAAG